MIVRKEDGKIDFSKGTGLAMVWALILLIIALLIVPLYFLEGSLSGYAVFSIVSAEDFDEGTYNNTEYTNGGVVLVNGSLEGSYLSKVFDAGNVSSWNEILLESEGNYENASLTLSVRSCDDGACDGENLTEVDAGELTIDDNQYFQYQIMFATDDANQSIKLTSVSINYTLIEEEIPVIIEIELTEPYAGESIDDDAVTLYATISHFNDSTMTATFYGDGSELIVKENLTDGVVSYDWNNLIEGSHSWYVDVSDGEINVTSEIRTFAIDLPNAPSGDDSTSGGDSGGDSSSDSGEDSNSTTAASTASSTISSTITYTVDETKLREGYEKAMPLNANLKFTLDGVSYTMKYIKNDAGKISIAVPGKEMQLKVGETDKADLNEDGTYDLEVELLKFISEGPLLHIKIINEEVPSDDGEEAVETTIAGEAVEGKGGKLTTTGIILIIASLAVLAGVGSYFVIRNGKKKSLSGGTK